MSALQGIRSRKITLTRYKTVDVPACDYVSGHEINRTVYFNETIQERTDKYDIGSIKNDLCRLLEKYS